MNNDNFEKEWDDQLSPVVHDDGKGISMCFHLDHDESETSFAVHLDARYPDEGLPAYDPEALAQLVVETAMEFAHIIWPDRVPNIDTILEKENDDTDTGSVST